MFDRLPTAHAIVPVIKWVPNRKPGQRLKLCNGFKVAARKDGRLLLMRGNQQPKRPTLPERFRVRYWHISQQPAPRPSGVDRWRDE